MPTLDETISAIGPPDTRVMAEARDRQNRLTKPPGSLGRLEEISVQIAGIRSTLDAPLRHKVVVTMAADHGVAAEGVSRYPAEVTRQMVLNFLRGGAAINVLAHHVGARVVVVDMGVRGGFGELPGLVRFPVASGTASMRVGPAMNRDAAVRAVLTGIKVVNGQISTPGLDIVGTGEMGIGNTTAASAITSVLTGRTPAEVTGHGTGIDATALRRKVAVIEEALARNRPDPGDALDVLAKVGGFEVGGLAGVMLGAAAARRPVVVDGFISGAAALIACALAPNLKHYLIPAHLSTEAGHRAVLAHLGLKPILNLDLRLGEGTGAALGISLVEAAVRLLNDMATFGEAGVSEAETG